MKKLTVKDVELYDDTAYEAWVKMPGIKDEIELIIDIGDGDEKKLAMLVEFTNTLLEWLVENDLVVKEYACKKMLKLKNKTWLEPKDKPLTDQQFIKRMKLTSINLCHDKTSTLFYDADEMFTDHAIIVEMNKNFKMTDANL